MNLCVIQICSAWSNNLADGQIMTPITNKPASDFKKLTDSLLWRQFGYICLLYA